MKQNLFRALSILVLAAAMTGCYSSVDGRMRAGVPFAKDFIESRYERPSAQAFQAAKEVLAFNGTLTSENTINSTLEAQIDTRSVWVRVEEVEPKVIRVITQARRKNRSADVDLASEIDKQIALKLSTMR